MEAAAHRRAAAAPPEPRRIDGLVGAFALGSLILALALVDLGGLWLRCAAAHDGSVSVALAGRSIAVPAAWLARAPEGEGRLDLAIPFAPAAGRPEERLYVTVVAAEAAPRKVPDRAPFLTAVARSHPSGLVQRRFRAGTPFEGEELYLAPPDGGGFAARCSAGAVEAELAGADCLAELGFDGLDLRIRFASARLGEWEAIVTTLKRALGA